MKHWMNTVHRALGESNFSYRNSALSMTPEGTGYTLYF